MKTYPDDWRVRLTTGIAVAGCMGAAMLFGPAVGINGFWPGLLAISVAIIAGTVLGRLLGPLLFRSPSNRPPEPPPRA